jgi:hypothetical protein
MTQPKRDLLLITGIPGTGKTTFGVALLRDFGFRHYDLEEQQTLDSLLVNPSGFIGAILRENKNTIVTWGFNPEHQPSVSAVGEFRKLGFKLIWFDGNRPAALREFIKRGTVPEVFFYLQMYRIEASKVVETIKSVIVDPC